MIEKYTSKFGNSSLNIEGADRRVMRCAVFKLLFSFGRPKLLLPQLSNYTEFSDGVEREG